MTKMNYTFLTWVLFLMLSFNSPTVRAEIADSGGDGGCKATCAHGECHVDGYGSCGCTADGYPDCRIGKDFIQNIQFIENSKGEVVANDQDSINEILSILKINPSINEVSK